MKSIAFIIAIDIYLEMQLTRDEKQLEHAVDSAVRFKNSCIPLNHEEVILLINGNANSKNIKNKLSILSRESLDSFVFYFVGHGRSNGLLLHGAGESNVYNTHELIKALNSIDSKTKTVILDCCHSGTIGLCMKEHLNREFFIASSSRESQSSWESNKVQSTLFLAEIGSLLLKRRSPRNEMDLRQLIRMTPKGVALAAFNLKNGAAQDVQLFTSHSPTYSFNTSSTIRKRVFSWIGSFLALCITCMLYLYFSSVRLAISEDGFLVLKKGPSQLSVLNTMFGDYGEKTYFPVTGYMQQENLVKIQQESEWFFISRKSSNDFTDWFSSYLKMLPEDTAVYFSTTLGSSSFTKSARSFFSNRTLLSSTQLSSSQMKEAKLSIDFIRDNNCFENMDMVFLSNVISESQFYYGLMLEKLVTPNELMSYSILGYSEVNVGFTSRWFKGINNESAESSLFLIPELLRYNDSYFDYQNLIESKECSYFARASKVFGVGDTHPDTEDFFLQALLDELALFTEHFDDGVDIMKWNGYFDISRRLSPFFSLRRILQEKYLKNEESKNKRWLMVASEFVMNLREYVSSMTSAEKINYNLIDGMILLSGTSKLPYIVTDFYFVELSKELAEKDEYFNPSLATILIRELAKQSMYLSSENKRLFISYLNLYITKVAKFEKFKRKELVATIRSERKGKKDWSPKGRFGDVISDLTAVDIAFINAFLSDEELNRFKEINVLKDTSISELWKNPGFYRYDESFILAKSLSGLRGGTIDAQEYEAIKSYSKRKYLGQIDFTYSSSGRNYRSDVDDNLFLRHSMMYIAKHEFFYLTSKEFVEKFVDKLNSDAPWIEKYMFTISASLWLSQFNAKNMQLIRLNIKDEWENEHNLILKYLLGYMLREINYASMYYYAYTGRLVRNNAF